ncbi:MAG: hypothetical protein H6733_06655 [Alphaproteobacteria bacterium]|nr:hypothetical protein [Alphaproteobacteria bacterium]
MARVTHHLDLCLPVPLMCLHDFTPVPGPVPPPQPGLAGGTAVEIPVPAGWGPGVALDACKLTTSVFLGAFPMCQEEHDCGALIPHVQVVPAPANLDTIGHVVNSARTARFSASTVKADGTALACMNLIGWPPAPMSCCSDPTDLPIGSALTNLLNTVEVGMTFGDVLAGWVAIAADALVDAACEALGGGEGADGPDDPWASVLADVVGDGVPTDRADLVAVGLKAAVSVGCGLVKIAATGEGDATAELTVGGPFLGLSVEVGASREDGAWGGVVSGEATGGPLHATVDPGGMTVAAGDPFGLSRTSVTTDLSGHSTETRSTITEDWGRSTVVRGADGTRVVSAGAPITSLPGAL